MRDVTTTKAGLVFWDNKCGISFTPFIFVIIYFVGDGFLQHGVGLGEEK